MSHITYIQKIINQLLSYYKDPHLCTQYAWWLIEKLCQKSKTELINSPTIDLTDNQQKQLADWITQLTQQHKPIQYVLGSVPFNDLDILVEPPILIPRSETEEWCANLITQLHTLSDQNLTILDLATGSGCIGLALARHLPKAHIMATDISPQALQLAQKNKIHNNIHNIEFIQSDLFSAIPSATQFDLIVSNPPYIAQSERSTLDQSVLEWEDENALFAADNGLAIIKKIITTASAFLRSHEKMRKLNIPQLMIEIGHKQGTLVENLMLRASYNNVQIIKDLEGKDRVVAGRVDYVATTTN